MNSELTPFSDTELDILPREVVDNLTYKQKIHLAALVIYEDEKMAKKYSQVSASSLTIWNKDENYLEAHRLLSRNMVEFAGEMMKNMIVKAMVRLDYLLDHPDPEMSTRAVKMVLDIMGKRETAVKVQINAETVNFETLRRIGKEIEGQVVGVEEDAG